MRKWSFRNAAAAAVVVAVAVVAVAVVAERRTNEKGRK